MTSQQQFFSTLLVSTQEIVRVIIKEKSNVLNGMGQGFLIGGGIGALVGLLSGNDPQGSFPIRFSAGEKALILGTTLGGVGLIIGRAAGFASSTSEKTIDPLPQHDFSSLKAIARYPSAVSKN